LILRLDSRSADFDAQLAARLAFEPSADAAIEQTVALILADVRGRGDAALLEYTRRFDRLDLSDAAALELSPQILRAAVDALDQTQREALEAAADRIHRYHRHQVAATWVIDEPDGTRLGQKITPLDRVGLYVPGGKAAYPSSVLMNAIPAKVAGVAELIMVVPTPDGVRNPMVLAAAAIAGVDRVFTIGGAQAIGALAWGTATVPRVDKIVGPGNAYVAEAKRRVFGAVGIDMIAGPSEILVISDGSAPADWIAMDLFSQAEHDELAQSILLTPDPSHLEAVAQAIDRLLPTMPRRATIERSLADRGVLVLVRDLQEACQIANRIAAEHLELVVADPWAWSEQIRHAGALFLGPWSSESLGDYCAGPNHVLPTMRTARFSSPLGVYDFQKRSSLIAISAAGAQKLGPIAATLAEGEGLAAHARSATLRLAPQATENGTTTRPESATPPHSHLRVPLHVVRADVLSQPSYVVSASAGLVKLDAMENPYPLPASLPLGLREQFAECLAQVALNRYPLPGQAGLKAQLARRAGVPNGFELLLGNGSDEIIAMLSSAVARPGAVIVAPVPGFVMYDVSARLAGCRFVGVPLQDDFALDLDALCRTIRRECPALIWLAFPNNPTGNTFDARAIETVLRVAQEAGAGFVVLDEAYRPFTSHSWMARLVDFPNLLVMQTLSKLGLAGVRLGYVAGRPEVLAELDKVRPPYNINVLTEAAAHWVLDQAGAVLDAQAARIRADRTVLASALSVVPGVQQVFPSEANFLLFRVSLPDHSPAGTMEALRARGVLIKDVSRAHPLLTGCLRVTVGTAEENAVFLHALRESHEHANR
jgi:histidinol dehydrogenase